MGDKITSRRIMQKSGVPVVPGMVDPLADADEAVQAGEEVGYPVMLKAAAGGGGKGIRIVREASEMAGAFRAASGEAESAFADGRMYVERYLERPRHIEVQVMFDKHGNAVHFGERECSVQRRHQKLVEECPSPVVDADLRRRLGEVALDAGRAVGYEGAGTVELMYSDAGAAGPEFYFLEMNTRLQVEHPITEMVTGHDLVRHQLLVASGEKLEVTQDEIGMTGHSIEVRINAEDPSRGFVPSTGTIGNVRWPGGPWVRFDSSIYRGMEVGLNYDPMLAKLIVWGPDRLSAIERMRRALAELNVGGVRTTVPAAMVVLENDEFRAGDYDTHLLETIDFKEHNGTEVQAAAISAAFHRWHQARQAALAGDAQARRAWLERGRDRFTPWKSVSETGGKA
jgi:acetyl-CoA carboxylase biotin carboxylase subunit